MRESVRKGSQDEEALCYSLALSLCLAVLASLTLNTYLDLTQHLRHINYLQYGELHSLRNIIIYKLFVIDLPIVHFS